MARLPTVGGDGDGWGTVLNDYLTQNIAGHYTLASSSSAGATSITLDKSAAGVLAGGAYIAVGATTTKCEVRRVTDASSATLTLDSALVYAHAADEFAWVVPGTLVPLDWFGCKANDSGFDSSVGIQQAFNDVALKAGRGYGLTGRGSRYYTATPLCVYDNTYLERVTITAKSPMSIDLTTGLDRMGTAGQYHLTLGGQFGTLSSVDTSGNTVTLNATAGGVNERVIFYAAQGATLPGGIEAGRHYFITTNPSGTTYTISEDYGGTTLDITSAESGTIYWYSPGMSRILWDYVTLEGAGIASLNGLFAALQQPASGHNVRIEDYVGAQGATTFFGQQAEFYNLMITGSTIGLNCQGMQFLHVFGGNLEGNTVGFQNFGIDPGGTSVADRDIQLHGIHFESNTSNDILAGNNLVGFGIYGGVHSGSAPFFTVDSAQVLGYSIQNFSSVSNTGVAVDDPVRGITLDWDDSAEDAVAGQIANLVAPATHGLNPSKSWWLFANDGAQHIVWDAHNADLRLNGTGTKIRFGDTGPLIRSGAGTPESAVTAPVGSLYLRTDGGTSTTLYVKESGTGNTGWVGK